MSTKLSKLEGTSTLTHLTNDMKYSLLCPVVLSEHRLSHVSLTLMNHATVSIQLYLEYPDFVRARSNTFSPPLPHTSIVTHHA